MEDWWAWMVDTLVVLILIHLPAALVYAFFRHDYFVLLFTCKSRNSACRGRDWSVVQLEAEVCCLKPEHSGKAVSASRLRMGRKEAYLRAVKHILVTGLANCIHSLTALLSVTSLFNYIVYLSVLQIITMFRSTSLLRTCHITLFTRSPCSLCDTAKSVLQTVRQRTPFEYTEINVMSPGQEKWKSVYEFDTPVVSTSQLM